jgi:nitrate/TMAO reductase-like tetraheme cytochrome c subunit
VYDGKPAECAACHQEDYDGTTEPDHFAAGFSLDCTTCHGTTSWDEAEFDHAATEFPLTGAHVSLDCQSCHSDGVYDGKATECAACHQDDYDATTDPDHFAAGFSLDCTACHGTASWTPASFDHNLSEFPLTGAHSALPCMDCHGDGVYNGKPTQCTACHQDDYDATTDPDHAAAQFPLDCTTCHDTAQWEGATFVHTWFPIYSGRHANEWDTCMDCHTSAQDFTQFSCLGCHPHSDQAKTDGNHSNEPGYQYESNACYNCHPQGTH